MLARTHFIVALFVYLICFNFIQDKLIFGAFLFLATFLVDIDSRKSKIGNHWFLRPMQWFIPHRGIFHSLFFAFLISYLIYLLNFQAALGFLVGYLLHLVLDCLTKQGVSLFKPFSSKKFKGFLKSGGIIEEIIFVLLLLADIFLVGKRFFEMLS